MAVTTPAPISRVYPRACGGTIPSPLQVATRSGLSPRLRGNQGPGPGRRLLARVYPRACGGTTYPATSANRGEGLSPRLRGNHHILASSASHIGSIPALAGEPQTSPRRFTLTWVYPRACGGNPRNTACRAVGGGSIPALAGEPARKIAALGPIKVYPRACGGTRRGSRGGGSRWGLSPRLRGNQDHNRRHYQQNGSIPALAGEPDIMLPSPVTSTVYPRACGGTVSWSCSS